MNLTIAGGLGLVTMVFITSIAYLVIKAGKDRKKRQLAARATKKAEAAAKHAAWEEWRKR